MTDRPDDAYIWTRYTPLDPWYMVRRKNGVPLRKQGNIGVDNRVYLKVTPVRLASRPT